MDAPLLQRFEPNRAGRDYVVGDIHGCFQLLEALLSHIGFDRQRDRLFSVGDLIDRGPESGRVTEFLSQPWFRAIRGNHEDMLLRGAHTVDAAPADMGSAQLWIANGGDWFFRLPRQDQAAIYRDVSALPHAIEVSLAGGRTAALVHADVLDDSWYATRTFLAGDDSRDYDDAIMHLLWARERAIAVTSARRGAADALSVDGADVVFLGHTPMPQPVACGNMRWVDTGAAYGGYLSIAELRADGGVWAMPRRTGAPVAGWTVVGEAASGP